MEVSSPRSSPRISFSTDHLLDDKDFICISPISPSNKEKPNEYPDFEFLLGSFTSDENVTTADELFFEGKLLPFQEMKQAGGQKLSNIRLKEKCDQDMEWVVNNQGYRINEDPSPKPPSCALLWKELFRLKKQRDSSFLSYPSSSSSNNVGDLPAIKEGKEESGGSMEKHVKRIKKGMERTRRSATTRRKERFY